MLAAGVALTAAIMVPPMLSHPIPLDVSLPLLPAAQEFRFRVDASGTYLLKVSADNALPDDAVGCMIYEVESFPNPCGSMPPRMRFDWRLQGPHTDVRRSFNGADSFISRFIGKQELGEEFSWLDHLGRGDYTLRITDLNVSPQLAAYHPRLIASQQTNIYDFFTPLLQMGGALAGGLMALAGYIFLLAAAVSRLRHR